MTETRQIWWYMRKWLVLSAIAFLVAGAVLGLVAGVASLVVTGGWSWAWCLKGVLIALVLLYFIGMPLLMAGSEMYETEMEQNLRQLREFRDMVMVERERLATVVAAWEGFQSAVPLQETGDAYVARCLATWQEAHSKAREWAGKDMDYATATPEERGADYDELQTRIKALEVAHEAYDHACHIVECLGFTIKRTDLPDRPRVSANIEQNFMDNRLGPDAP